MKSASMLTILFLFCSTLCADTFTNKKTGASFTGFATAKKFGDKTIVISKENGKMCIIPSYYNISYDTKGRKSTFATIKITDGPKYQMEIDAIEKEIKTATNRGYLFILIELDAKGGNPYIDSKLCSAIANNWQCPSYCYIRGNGAHDYTALIPLSCKNIFISSDATFGSKESLDSNEQELNSGIIDLHKAIGSNVGEKFTSILRATASSLAQNNDRPTLLAQAMFDNQVEVIEIKSKDGSDFISPSNKKKSNKVIKTISKKGNLLQLSAQEALRVGMVDAILDSEKDVLTHLNANNAEKVSFDEHLTARETMDSVMSETMSIIDKINALGEKIKTTSNTRKKVAAIKSMVRRCYKLKKIAIGYPELEIPPNGIESAITYYNSQLRAIKNNKR